MARTVQTPVEDGLQAWASAFMQPTVLGELGALALCAALAAALVALLRRGAKNPNSILLARSVEAHVRVLADI